MLGLLAGTVTEVSVGGDTGCDELDDTVTGSGAPFTSGGVGGRCGEEGVVITEII